MEGYVSPDGGAEGPFGDHTGFYSLEDDFPVFHVTAVTRRRAPVYLTTIVGKPPMEDGFLAKQSSGCSCPREKTIGDRGHVPAARRDLPQPHDRCDRQAFPGHARKTMHAIWGTGQMMFSKTIVVVDKDVSVRNAPELVWKVLTAIDPERDIEFVHGPVDELDFASRLPCYGSKMGIDATRKWKGEGFDRRWPDEIVMSREVKARVDELWPSLGILLGRKP